MRPALAVIEAEARASLGEVGRRPRSSGTWTTATATGPPTRSCSRWWPGRLGSSHPPSGDRSGSTRCAASCACGRSRRAVSPSLSWGRRPGRRHRGAPVRPARLRGRLAADRERVGGRRRQVRHRCGRATGGAHLRRGRPTSRPRAGRRSPPGSSRSRVTAATPTAPTIRPVGPRLARAVRSGSPSRRSTRSPPSRSRSSAATGRRPFQVRSTHSELVDPFRSGVPGSAETCP